MVEKVVPRRDRWKPDIALARLSRRINAIEKTGFLSFVADQAMYPRIRRDVIPNA